MNNNQLVSFRYKYPWALILILQLSIFFLIGYSLSSANWVGCRDTNSGIIEITHKKKPYNIIADYKTVCDIPNSHLCERVDSLRKSLKVSLPGFVLTLILGVPWIFSSFSFLIEKNYFRSGRILGNLVTLSFTLSLICWTISENVWICDNQVKNNCSAVCFEQGFMVNLIILVLMCFTQLFYNLIGKISVKLSDLGFKNLEAVNECINHRRSNSGYPQTEISRIVN